MTVPTPPTFATRADYDAWWMAHSIEINRLSVTAPAEYERIAARIEALLARIA